MFFDVRWFLFALPGLLLGLWAQAKVKGAFSKYSKVATARHITGAEVARALLEARGLHDVQIETARGMLSDHYDPRTKTLRLSPQVYGQPSVAAAGVAAHETGHALQHAAGYAPLQLRSAIVPVAQFGSSLAPLLFIVGLLIGSTTIAWVGVVLFAAAVVFTLVTLPVEFDASNRAKRLLTSHNIVVGNEAEGVSKVLNAAAWTYVAAAVSAVGQLLYFVLLLGGVGGRRE
ncbi:MAG: zinc metallopeptidase [Candidatus Promineifilaceae bacterium]